MEVRPITTKGDAIQHLPLDKIGDKGIFTQAIEAALLSGEIDFAVHSMKDMPSQMDDRLAFACVPRREDPRDVLVLAEGYRSLRELPGGQGLDAAASGESASCWRCAPTWRSAPFGGISTPASPKSPPSTFTAPSWAAAGMHRLGLEKQITGYFSTEEMIPACAQGALAIQVRQDREELFALLASLHDPQAARQVAAERAYLTAVGGGCHLPVGPPLR